MSLLKNFHAIRRPRLWIALLLSCLAAAALFHFSCAKESDLPNVILICIDTLRADHLGCYGYGRSTSPAIDSLAAVGFQFRNVRAQSPWTLPSHTTLFSSTFPFTHGVVDDNSRIPADVPMMADILKSHGYHCAAVVTGFYVGSTFGFDRGFDDFEDFGLKRHQPLAPRFKILAETVTDRGLEWLDGRDGPFFLFLHYFDVHFNYVVPEPYRNLFEEPYQDPAIIHSNPWQELGPRERLHILAQYDAAIAYVDANIRRLLVALEEEGLSDNTLLIITSDHGEELFERGSWGHGHTLYREVLEVPLIVVDPRSKRSGRRINETARLIDVFPTLLEALRLPPVEGTQGRSLWPLLNGDTSLGSEPLLLAETSRYDENQASLTREAFKLIANLKDDWVEIYDLENDPGERVNLSSKDSSLDSTLLNETLTISANLIPGRVCLRWRTEDRARRFSGTVRSPGALIRADYLGEEPNPALLEDPHCLTFSSGRDGEIRLAVLPVDAAVSFDLQIDGEAARDRSFVGGEAIQVDEMPIMFPGVIRSPHLLQSPPDRGAGFYIWKDPGDRMAAEPVDLSEEAKEHLRSLGYVH